MSVVAFGLNHRTVPLPILERLAIGADLLPKLLADLGDREHVHETVVVATCNRTEVYIEADRFHESFDDVRSALAETCHVLPEVVGDALTVYYEEEAVEHLFRVTAGLESAVLGEHEILGQIKSSWERARTEDACRSGLDLLFRRAVETGKRARNETAISRGTSSISHAAVEMAQSIVGELSDRRVLVVGAGDVAEGVAAALARTGTAGVVVANRNRARAESVAAATGGTAAGLDELDALIADADVVITSTGAPDPVVFADGVERSLASREAQRALLFVDVALPRDVDAGVANLDGVTVADLADLQKFASAGAESRSLEVAAVEGIVGAEVSRYFGEIRSREVVPLIADLRSRAEAVRLAELATNDARLARLDDADRALVEQITKRLVAKLLHEPTVELKNAAGTPRGQRNAAAIAEVFKL